MNSPEIQVCEECNSEFSTKIELIKHYRVYHGYSMNDAVDFAHGKSVDGFGLETKSPCLSQPGQVVINRLGLCILLKPKTAQHVIEFPGGAIEVSRTPDGNYWAHIIVNRHQTIDECKGRQAAFGEIVGSRITADNGVNPVPDYKRIKQVAILIKPCSDAT